GIRDFHVTGVQTCALPILGVRGPGGAVSLERRLLTEDDRELLRRMARSDQSAMDAFYRAYEGRVYRFIRSKLNDSFEAGDVLNRSEERRVGKECRGQLRAE